MLRKRLLSGALVLALCFGSAQATGMVPDFKPMDNWGPYMGEAPFTMGNSITSMVYAIDSDSLLDNFMNQWGEMFDLTGYQRAYFFSEGLAYVKKDDTAGFIDITGAMVFEISPDYKPVKFHEGIACLQRNGTPSNVLFIDKQGTIIYECPDNIYIYVETDFFSEGVIPAKDTESGQYGYLNSSGAWELTPQYESTTCFSNGYARVISNGKYGVIDRSWNQVIPCEYDMIQELSPEGQTNGDTVFYARNIESEKWLTRIILADGTILMEWSDPCGLETLADGLCPFWDGDAWYYRILDLDEQTLSETTYRKTGDRYYEGLLQVQEFDGPWKYIDTQLNDAIILPDALSHYEPGSFLDGLASVRDENGNGYQIDRTGAIVFDAIPYQYRSSLYEGACVGFRETPDLEHAVIFDPRMKDAVSSWALDGVEEAKASGLVTESNDAYFGFRITRRRFAELAANLVEQVTGQEITPLPEGHFKDTGLVTESNDAYFGFRITRRRFAELAANLVEQVTGQEITPLPEGHFKDTDDLWVRKAAALGLVNGIDDGSRFSPNGYISREQLSAVLCRTITYLEGQTGVEVLPTSGDLSGYSDGDQVSAWAREPMAALCAAGILQGTSDTTLSPKDTTTVEQAILLTLRAYQLFKT